MVPFKTRAIFSYSGDKNNGYLGFIEDDVIQITKIIDNDTFYGISMRTKLKGIILKKYVDSPEFKRGHSSSSTINTDFSNISNFGGSQTTITNEFHGKYNLQQSPPPPPTPKHEDNLILNKKFKSSYVQQLLNSSLTETEKSSSLFGHSDFSATSAGSLIRHKDVKEFDFTDSGGNPLRDRLNSALNEVEFNRHKKSGFLQRIMGKSNEKELSFDDSLIMSMDKHTIDDIDDSLLSIGNNTTIIDDQFNEFEFNLKRSISIKGRERSRRSKRLVELQPDIVLKPHEFITEFNKNEIIPNFNKKEIDIDDNRVLNLLQYILQNPKLSLDKIILLLETKLDNDLEKHKAIYLYLTKFKISESILEKVSLKRMPNFEDLPNILKMRECSNHQLVWIYYIIANKLNFDVELILGYFKYPYQFDESIRNSNKKLTINHSWISIQFNGTYYFCDLVLGCNNSTIINSNSNEDNYILLKPFEIVSTHIPMHIDQQHITPPIDPIVQLNMPPNYPFFNKFGIKFINFNSSLFHLKDFEIFDFKLKVPLGIQIKCNFQPFDNDIYPSLTPLIQIYFNDKKEKIVNIKGILPQFCPAGVLYINAKSEINDFWEIITSIPAYHVGKWKQIKWLKIDNSNIEKFGSCYIKSPKISKLPFQSQVNFKFKLTNFKSDKLILVNPRNKKLNFDVNGINSIDEMIHIDEIGDWKLVIPDHQRNVLKVIAQWKSE